MAPKPPAGKGSARDAAGEGRVAVAFLEDAAPADDQLRDLVVLVVDDSPNMLKLLRTLLRALGTGAPFEAVSAAEALRLLNDVPVDVVITDLAMKPVSGLDLVKALRAHPRAAVRRLPIVMLTGHTDAELVLEARDAGIDDFLAKPVAVKTLGERLARIVTSRRPFVATPAYTGPERRVRSRPVDGPDRRRR